MLFNKSIVSFFAAIALASSVTAAGQQVKAQDVVPTCSTGSPTCCGSTIPFSGLTPAQKTELHSLDSNVNEGLNVGLNCVVANGQGCGNNQPLCCDPIQNTADLQGVAANCVSA
ncbi:hypothetical protein EI94DRAFT_1719412 [Lactarius quietus]|nr:hypothetical protein EI94DRAFT_1719412 [Lactarius quietus]